MAEGKQTNVSKASCRCKGLLAPSHHLLRKRQLSATGPTPVPAQEPTDGDGIVSPPLDGDAASWLRDPLSPPVLAGSAMTAVTATRRADRDGLDYKAMPAPVQIRERRLRRQKPGLIHGG